MYEVERQFPAGMNKVYRYHPLDSHCLTLIMERERQRHRERERIYAKVKLVKQCCESEISETMLLSACPERLLLLAVEI